MTDHAPFPGFPGVLALPRQPSVAAHLERSQLWSHWLPSLGPTALIYGAIELRMGVESALAQMLVRVRGSELDESDMKAFRSAKAMQARIHTLEGHQQVLDRKLDFHRMVLDEAGLARFPLARVSPGKAFAHWQGLSEVCHFGLKWNEAWEQAAKESLANAEAFLTPIASTLIVWPTYPPGSEMRELEEQYAIGAIDAAEVKRSIEEMGGVWAHVTLPDGTKRFGTDLWGEVNREL